MSPANIPQHLGEAVFDQGFRQIDIAGITRELLTLNGPASISAAFAAVGREPAWGEIIQQLTSYRLPGMQSVWLRRDHYDIEIAALYAWNGVLTSPPVKTYSDGLWPATKALRPLLGSFNLQGGNLQVIEQAAAGSIPQLPPAAKSLADTVLALNYSRTPSTTILAIGLGGLDSALINQAESWFGNPFAHKDNAPTMSVTATYQTSVVVDATNCAVHGQTQPHTINLGDLGRTLRLRAG